ncbi:MAG: ABC-2 type transport system permease protein [Polyangiales bacterium]
MTSLTMLLAMITKELQQILRDKRMMLLLLGVPVVQLIIFGFAVDLDVDEVPTVIVDHDASALSRHHLARILADGTLSVVYETPDLDLADSMLATGEAAATIIVPEGFERDVIVGRTGYVQVVLDGTDPNRANVVGSTVSSYFLGEGRALAAERLRSRGVTRRMPSLDMRSRVFFNPSLKSAIYMVPGVAAILLMLITTLVTAMGLSREREAGTLEQVLVTPMPGWVLIAGKILPFAAFGLFDFILAIVVGAYVFQMPIVGSVPLLLGATGAYLLVTLGMGLLIATFSSGQQQAFMGGFLFMLPAALLSGIMTPVHSMPEWMQVLTLANPLRHYAEVLRGVLLRGASAQDLLVPLSVLVLMGVSVFALATRRFSNSMR